MGKFIADGLKERLLQKRRFFRPQYNAEGKSLSDEEPAC